MTEAGPLAASVRVRPRRISGLVWFVARRIGVGLLTLVVVSVLIFLATEILPGNVATAVLGREATPQSVAAISRQLHLGDPPYTRYYDWVTGLFHGDMGESIASQATGGHASVSSIVGPRLKNSLVLALITFALLIPLGLVVGAFVGTRPGTVVDHTISLGAVAVISLPEFVTGTVLILVFAVGLGVLPPASFLFPGQSPLSDPSILVLPVCTLLAASLAQMIRMVRAGVIDAMRTPFVEMARLDGFSESRVTRTFALRNSIAPVIQVIALNMQWLIGGIVVTETVFGYPGVGQAIVQAVNLRDIPTVQALGIIIAAVYIATNIVADVVVVLAIPKLRTEME
jgi:peptide/nickel transport system permease protein